MDTARLVRLDDIRMPPIRDSLGSCLELANSIIDMGQQRPIILWSDGTLISGRRRAFAHMLLQKGRIEAVYVNNLEDAAKRLRGDNEVDYGVGLKMKYSEICRLWALLRQLDAPAAAMRAHAARARGVELRRATQAGLRKAGRSGKVSEDFVLEIICEPFGISLASARRLQRIYNLGYVDTGVDLDRRNLAREALKGIDDTGNIWGNSQRLVEPRQFTTTAPAPKIAPVIEPVAAARQITVWEKAIPQMEGLVAGLMDLGPTNPDLTWAEIGPVCTRLSLVRRNLEKMIRQMKETEKS